MFRFLFRYSVKAAIYFAILLAFVAIGLLPASAITAVLVAALVLAAVNTLIRPVLAAIALPVNMFTCGIASLFVNLLMLVIASGIVGGTITSGFWAMLLVALVIMLADDAIRILRQKITRPSF